MPELINFSSETREFETGAHRGGGDKAPVEYLPLAEAVKVMEIAQTLPSYNMQEGFLRISNEIEKFKETANIDCLAMAGAIFGKLYFKNIYECMAQTSEHFKKGAEKYGRDNWKNGMPLSVYVGSLIRHLLKIVDCWDDESHHTAVMWNVLAAMWTAKNKPDMNDLVQENNKNNKH